MSITRRIRWSALTCRLRGTDIYLGLAASLDDLISDLISAEHMVAFPLQEILLTVGDRERTPLRVYAVRDPSLVTVTEGEVDRVLNEPDFRRVTIELNLDAARLAATVGAPSAVDEKATVVPPSVHASIPSSVPPSLVPPSLQGTRASKPVIAFLLTVGLARHEEDEFFHTVLREFISKSWMTFPALLRNLGCSSASDLT